MVILLLIVLILMSITLYLCFDIATKRSLDRVSELIQKIRDEHPVVKNHLSGEIPIKDIEKKLNKVKIIARNRKNNRRSKK